MSAGWRWAAKRDDRKKLHPALLPYSALSEGDKQWDKDSARQTLAVIRVLGYLIQRVPAGGGAGGAGAARRRGTLGGRGAPGGQAAGGAAAAALAAAAVGLADDLAEEEEGGEGGDPAAYVPAPIDTSSIALSREIGSLVEMLAKNTHDVRDGGGRRGALA